ncbi:maleylpyruvate isomerase family mycothiol-dependent enzyme [Nesterenkonia ebinurensis]|uniref:maleylpyruvate isomerase family mycothiol-dependent enzyme n=1 Tax=Nesterenkonia ebinurensis TaxID=2608252 RepID=UPI00168BFDD7|nr:maleylpyruvate isomerase family mycothiol-dependent enzyme [Nesterenkonia ebinurensis]
MISPTGRPWLDELTAATEQFRAVIASAENDDAALASPVAACPRWGIRDLAVHLGRTHLWATQILDGADPRDRPQDEPSPDESLAAWYGAVAEKMRKALAEAGPDKPCWTLVKEQRTAVFWQRRQVHETVVHLWDAQHALGRSAEMDPVLAFDGVAEVAEVMYPRMLRAERVSPLPKQLVLTATDLDTVPVKIGDAERSLMVRASAAELLLLVWHRLPWHRDYGDAEAAELIGQSLVP